MQTTVAASMAAARLVDFMVGLLSYHFNSDRNREQTQAPAGNAAFLPVLRHYRILGTIV